MGLVLLIVAIILHFTDGELLRMHILNCENATTRCCYSGQLIHESCFIFFSFSLLLFCYYIFFFIIILSIQARSKPVQSCDSPFASVFIIWFVLFLVEITLTKSLCLQLFLSTNNSTASVMFVSQLEPRESFFLQFTYWYYNNSCLNFVIAGKCLLQYHHLSLSVSIQSRL